MNNALLTKWVNNTLVGPLPPNFYIEIRALTPGGKRTQFTYIPIQNFLLAAAGIEPADLEILVGSVVAARIDELVANGSIGNDLISTNW